MKSNFSIICFFNLNVKFSRLWFFFFFLQNFLWIYIREYKNSKISWRQIFADRQKIPQNPRNLIHATINLRKN